MTRITKPEVQFTTLLRHIPKLKGQCQLPPVEIPVTLTTICRTENGSRLCKVEYR